MPAWSSANLLESAPGGRRLWQLSVADGQFTVLNDTTLAQSEPTPEQATAKDWQNLFRPKLNIAWLPAEKGFLRVVHLPTSDPAEITAMIELQLEKLSPLPVTHIVWSCYPLPKPADKPDALQTVIVIIALRAFVEEYLRDLEGVGYMADRLEAPGLDELLSTDIREDGVWIFPGGPGQPALVVWWGNGAIQNLSMLSSQAGPQRAGQLKSQIEQIAWAGELEGWLQGTPSVHLVARDEEAKFWEPVLREWPEKPVDVRTPLTPEKLAAFGARRCGTNGSATSLLPAEFASRYQQQFIDGLWMRGLFTVVGIYLTCVLVYFGALYGSKLQLQKAQRALSGLSEGYTNALRDVEQIHILKSRAELQYAALDAWKAIAEALPESVTVDDFYFSNEKLELRGTVTVGDEDGVTTFNEALRHATRRGFDEPLFADVGPPSISTSATASTWRFSCRLLGEAKP